MGGSEPRRQKARLHDVTLRDGNHALRHQLTPVLVAEYCRLASTSPLDSIEVGHGNGLGASSALVGLAASPDHDLLEAARENLGTKKLAVHCIPGFATVGRDLAPAMRIGVDIFRIASHVTESDTCAKHVEFVRSSGREAVGVLMMSHMAEVDRLVTECRKLEAFGATSIVIMDSAGHFVPSEVALRIQTISQFVGVELGFHAHNNLGVAIANAIAARSAGASILDGAAMGLGAGAGNAQMECLGPVLAREEGSADYGDVADYVPMSDLILKSVPDALPRTTSSSVLSATAGVFSGYAPQVSDAALEFGVDPARIWRELGLRSVVAGQETVVREVAIDLARLGAHATSADGGSSDTA